MASLRLLGLLACASLLLAGCSEGSPERDGGAEDAATFPTPLRDPQGRAVFYLGVNVSEESKWAADLLPEIDDDEYDLLADWGVTLVRLLVFWEGIEPEEGVFDDDYLAGVRGELDRLEDRGFDVVLDMHQDLFGRGFGYAGAPRWACPESYYETFVPTDPWFLGYLSEEIKGCFDRFWGSGELWDHYREAWTRAAAALGDHPAVVGFELMNEPFPQSTSADFENEYLVPFYEHVDDGPVGEAGLWILREPALTYNFDMSTRLPAFVERQVFAPHYYPSSVTGDQPERIRADVAGIAGDAIGLGAPLVVGELGTANDTGDGLDFLSHAIDATLESGGSPVVWDFGHGGPGSFSLLQPDGTPYAFHAALLRPYAHRVAGRLVSTGYDRAERTLEVTWESGDGWEPTVVVVPAAAFGTVEVSSTTDSDDSWSFDHDEERGRLTLTVDQDVRVHSFRVTAGP